MAYNPPDLSNITFDMPSPYTAPSAGSITITIGGVTTTVVDMITNPLEINVQIAPDETPLWFLPLESIEGLSEIGTPGITLSIEAPPFETTVSLIGSAQQRVTCQPIGSTQTIEIVGIVEVPEDYTVVSPWPFEMVSSPFMSGVAIAVVDASIAVTSSLGVPFIEANGLTTIDIPPVEIAFELSTDLMPVLYSPGATQTAELQCSAIRSMPAGDQYLWCPPFQTTCSVGTPNPLFGFQLNPIVVESDLSVDDVYSGFISVLDPIQITQELESLVSAAIVLKPLEVTTELAPVFSSEIGLYTPAIEIENELSTGGVTIGTFVELVPIETRSTMDANIQYNIWLSDDLPEGNGHFSVPVTLGIPGIVSTVICPAFNGSSVVSLGDIKLFTLDLATRYYYFTITGVESGVLEVEIPISSFQARRRNGAPSYLQVTIPGLDYVEQINDRVGGDLRVWLVYKLDGDEVSRRELVTATMDDIRIDEGANSKSITLTGYKTETFTPTTVEMTGTTYKNIVNGKYRFRIATPNTDLRPGDTVTIDGTTFTADIMSYYFTATRNGINQNMEIAEE